jgi:uncharacterized protein YrrD
MRQVAAAVTYGSDALNLQSRAIPGGKIRVWGRDALLTDRPDIANRPGDSREMETWPRVVRQLKGRKVITAAGTHIGTLYDLIINDRGQILDYDLSEVMIEGPIAYSRQVPADAYRLLQSDALIVDASRLE